MSTEKYIYSIIQEKRPRKFSVAGLEGEAVYTINCADLAAVTSNYSVTDFNTLSKEELTAHVASHQKVNEELLKSYDVVPMAFGMAAENEEELINILSKAYIQFKRALKKVANKTEFAVQTFWDEKTILDDLVNNNLEIKQLNKKAESGGKVQRMATRLRLGKLVADTLRAQKEHYNNEVEEKLKGCSYDIKHAKLLDENMVSNLSLLVDKFREDELDKKMQGLGDEYKNKLRFKYIGPMAPSSFVNINLSLGNYELINNARQLLGIPEEATFDNVKSVYLGLAQKYHPDKHEYTNNPRILEKMTQKMKEVQEAYEALESYCRLCSSPTPNDTYSFRQEDVEKTLIIKES